MARVLDSTSILSFTCSVLIPLTACNPHPLKPVELQTGQECQAQVELSINKDVDILFVIDNSGSMGEEQANLAANFGAFIELLEDSDVGANYRIGVTTSDNGNPWCPPGTTTPEGGKLVMSSCKDRLGDFVFDGGMVDVQDLACNDICTLSAAELEIVPTATDVDPNLVARPWLENIEGKKNIPAGTDTADAFKCFGPQGINGCGFESQLESMYLSLARAADSNEANYGFLRDDAILAVVIVTDEVDCSYNKSWKAIFEQSGNKVFWSDPSASFPTSAVCWNAGVECFGDPSGYDDCVSANKDVEGNLDVTDADAVLHPVHRYLDRLQGIENAKKEINPDQEIIVALIGGVANDGSTFYADVTATDPEFQDSFGIGPGCTAPGGVTAVPPVRERELTEAFTPGNMFSVCNANYTPALQAIADKLIQQIKPACYTQCVEDRDLATALIEPECSVEQKVPGEEPERLEECKRNADGSYAIDPDTDDYAMPNGEVDVCYALLTDDAGLTPDTRDDLSSECSEGHYNLEFEVARRLGFPAPGGTAISATCSLSDFPQVDCPGSTSSGAC
ncbi:vWA domain-containing protein [Nannocystaceae bacterium ST9]